MVREGGPSTQSLQKCPKVLASNWKDANAIDAAQSIAKPHVLTSFEVTNPSAVHVVRPSDVPNPNWLVPGTPTAGQQ